MRKKETHETIIFNYIFKWILNWNTIIFKEIDQEFPIHMFQGS